MSKLRTHAQILNAQRADEAELRRSAFRIPLKLPRALDAEERDLLLKVVGQIVRPVVVPEPFENMRATPSPISPKRSRTPLRIGSRASNRVPRLAACRPMHSVVQLIAGHEDAGRALTHGQKARAPHHIGGLGGDGPVVRLRAVRVAHAVRGLEGVLLRTGAPAPGTCGFPRRRSFDQVLSGTLRHEHGDAARACGQ